MGTDLDIRACLRAGLKNVQRGNLVRASCVEKGLGMRQVRAGWALKVIFVAMMAVYLPTSATTSGSGQGLSLRAACQGFPMSLSERGDDAGGWWAGGSPTPCRHVGLPGMFGLSVLNLRGGLSGNTYSPGDAGDCSFEEEDGVQLEGKRKLILERSWEKSYQDGQPNVWAAARYADLEGLRGALEKGGNLGSLNEPDADKKTALHWAVSVESIECVEELLSRGARIDTVDEYGWTPVHTAASVGNVKVFKLLMDAAEKEGKLQHCLNMQSCSNSLTMPLHHIAGKKHVELLKFCLDYPGVNIEPRDASGATPIMRAVVSGSIEVVEALIIKGADVNVQDDEGNSTLHFACECQDETMCSFLVSRGADPLLENNEGMLPVDHLEFGMARRVSRAYNEYRKGMGMKHRSEQEQKRLEDEAMEAGLRQKPSPVMSWNDNDDGYENDSKDDSNESQSEATRMRTNVYLPTDMM